MPWVSLVGELKITCQVCGKDLEEEIVHASVSTAGPIEYKMKPCSICLTKVKVKSEGLSEA